MQREYIRANTPIAREYKLEDYMLPHWTLL
jgi:hypothetical protein